MPRRAKKPCRQPGCAELVSVGYCAEHKRAASQEYDSRRGSRHQRGYGHRWQKVRRIQLAQHPLCHDCEQLDMVTAANEVHHLLKKSAGGSDAPNNLMSLCKSCHSTRTARGE